MFSTVITCRQRKFAKNSFLGQPLKSDTAIREPEPGTRTGTAHNLCKLSHFITAGDRSNNIFQGGRIVSEQFVKISLNHEGQYSSVKSLVYLYCLA